jgi:tetratricopeptide (TPR) repeat protein
MHPTVGVGANNWQIYFPSNVLPDIYPIRDLNVTFQRPHNDFLWILSEYGIIGFNLFLIFITGILFLIYLKIANHFDPIYVIILSGILGFLAISFFDFPKERIEHNILFYVLIGIAYYLIKQETFEFKTGLFYLPKIVLKILIVILIMIFYFGWLNFKGEYFTKKMYVERIIKNNKNVIYFCDKAQSFCYNIDPTSIPLCWYKGNANANLGNYAAALEDFKNAFRFHPYNHNVLNDLGSSYFMNSKIDSAKIFYMESSRINPSFDDPKLNLTAIFINEGNYNEAQKWNESIFHNSERRDYYRSIINNHK